MAFIFSAAIFWEVSMALLKAFWRRVSRFGLDLAASVSLTSRIFWSAEMVRRMFSPSAATSMSSSPRAC